MEPKSNEAFRQRVRQFEQRLLAHMGETFCPVHLSLGQEWVAADLYGAIEPHDWLFSHHRNHGHYLAKGGSEQKLWDEIMGLPSGVNGGFSGSQAVSDPSINFHSSAIVGGLVGVATGCAHALKGTGAVAICIVGDAGTEAGIYWESLNFAALHCLPIAYIVENNGMSVDSPIADRQAMPLITRAKAFGLQCAESITEAIDLARNGEPSFFEAKVKLECHHIYGGFMKSAEVIA